MPSLTRERNMQLCRDLTKFRPGARTAIAIGNFDGLHRGHQVLLAAMLAAADARQLVPTVLTFEPHPRRLFAPSAPPFRLEPLRDKLERLRAMGVAHVVAPRFTRAFASLSADQFMNHVLNDQLQAGAIFVGENFGFGSGRTGTTRRLKEWGDAHGIDVQTMAPVMVDGEICSSSAVRAALGTSEFDTVRALLGRDYSIQGRVVRGEQRGRELGYPTANIVPAASLKLPNHGIYAVRARIAGESEWRDGVASFGLRPTVAITQTPWLEVHLFDYQGDLYGRRLDVAFIARLRDEEKFDSVAAMTRQIAADAQAARRVLREHA